MGECFVPHSVRVQKDLVLGHLLLGEVVTLIHLSYEVEGFGFLGNDDIDRLASFLLFGELASKRDDVGHVGVGCPCLIEGFGGVGAFLCHNLAPVGSEMMENTFDGAVGVTKIFFVQFFDVLFFNAVDDALQAWCTRGWSQSNVFNPTLRLFSHISCTRLHTTSDDDQTRRHKKHKQ